MVSIAISDNIKIKCPTLILNCFQCQITVSEENKMLWLQIDEKLKTIQNNLKLDEISRISSVHFAREAYKALGKDPARYRLSAEALMRRIIQGKGLYRVNNAIDILNFISVQSGISIGGYDTAKIKGSVLLSAGKENDLYQAIGRGPLNIDCLPVLNDQDGSFGNPTSDSERTSVTLSTQSFLMVFFNFEGTGAIQSWINESKSLLIQFAQAKNFKEFSIT